MLIVLRPLNIMIRKIFKLFISCQSGIQKIKAPERSKLSLVEYYIFSRIFSLCKIFINVKKLNRYIQTKENLYQ